MPRGVKKAAAGFSTTMVVEQPAPVTVAPETNGTKPHADVVAGKKKRTPKRQNTALGTSQKFATDAAKRLRRGATPIQADALRMVNLATRAFYEAFFLRAAVYAKEKGNRIHALGPEEVHDILSTLL
jgi:hypothetical protein